MATTLPAPARAHLQHHFDNLAQQAEAASLGMWVFIVTEILFFGGMFTAYLVYRMWYPDVFARASQSCEIVLGTANTAILITSSLTMALAVYSAAEGRSKAIIGFLVLTMLLGMAFLGVKFTEYYHKYEEHLIPGPGFRFEGEAPYRAQIFFSLYFLMTGLHALHMIIGIGVLSVLIFMAWRRQFSPEWHVPVELGGLYWHFVDIIWIFLFPLLYLIDRHHG
jgi:cytochrome c oxidase subunit III